MKIKLALKTTAIALLAAVLLVGYQLFMTVGAADKARETAIQEWLTANPERDDEVAHYRKACEKGITAVHPTEQPLLTFSECAALIDSSLAEVIQQASSTVQAPAPLRWL